MSKGKHSFVDIAGQRFGHLTAIEMVGVDSKSRLAMWRCKCDCGNEKVIKGKHLRCGEIKSCGCIRKTETAAKLRETSTTHGMTNTRLYGIWCGIKSRCYNSHRKKHKEYGGRGITICDEWRDSFEAFRDWALANGYQDNLTIDRINNNGPYCPENCRWVSMKEQQNNRRNNRMLTIGDETKTMQQWADKMGIKSRTIQQRLNRGWSVEKAIMTETK